MDGSFYRAYENLLEVLMFTPPVFVEQKKRCFRLGGKKYATFARVI